MLRILDKPAGLTTHSSLSSDDLRRLATDPVDSLLGHLSDRSGITLWPLHRLDLGTTGVLLATDSAAEAAELSKAFEERDVEKTYYFLADREVHATTSDRSHVETSNDTKVIRVESFIDRHSSGGKGSNFFSHQGTAAHPVNAITTFEFVRKHDGFSLWRARPLTGRPHQIRLHAESLGISILGDVEHGGTRFPALCLHAAEVRLSYQNETITATSPLPRWFDDMRLISHPAGLRLINWLAAIERRERLLRSLAAFAIAPSETIRWIHTEGQDLRADQLGSIVQFHWYGAQFSNSDHAAIAELAHMMAWKDWYIQTRMNRGKNPNETDIVLSRPDLPTRWHAREDAMYVTFRRDTGLSSGLFLDQRANRRWVRDHARGARVLNLFSYTSGFSVAAALGSAAKIVSVDLSKNFLEWSKENFTANNLEIDSRFEFRAMEARDFLKWAKKKDLLFDLVICDPPSFARTDKGVFRIETEFENLLELCLDVTAPRGRILFSLNYELFDEDDFFARADAFTRRSRRTCQVVRSPSPDLDFEFPRERRAMKSLFVLVEPPLET